MKFLLYFIYTFLYISVMPGRKKSRSLSEDSKKDDESDIETMDTVDDKSVDDSDSEFEGSDDENDEDVESEAGSDSETEDKSSTDDSDAETEDAEDAEDAFFEEDLIMESDVDRFNNRSLPFLNVRKKERPKFSRKTVVITDPEKFVTKLYLTKYELARCLSERANMLEHGSQPLVESTESESFKEVALREIRNKKCPMFIYRPVPHFKDIILEKHDINTLQLVE